MAKRRPGSSNLPLFDLPLREAAERQAAEKPVVVPVPPPLDLAEDPKPTFASASKTLEEQPVVRPAPPQASPTHQAPTAQPAVATDTADGLLFDPFDAAPARANQPAATSTTASSSDLAWDVDDEPMLFTDDDLLPVGDPGATAEGVAGDDANGTASEVGVLVQDRLLGGIADLTLHLAVIGAMVLAVLAMGVPLNVSSWAPFATFALLFSFLYSVIPLAFWGQTPGMAWVGHVARTEADEPLTFGQTVNRWLGAVLTTVLVGLPLLLAVSGHSLADRLSHSITRQV